MRRATWRWRPGRAQNLRGPNCALTLDEQLEIRRLMERATLTSTRGRTAVELADRYGVSIRSIWRYARRLPVPLGAEKLAPKLRLWAKERDIRLTTDDLLTLMLVVVRHRDAADREDAA